MIYPVGYLYSPEVAIMTPNEEMMAVAYNIADSINKIGFGVVAWMGAKKATAAMA
ncbi:MAG: bacteriorhodopsin [Candidatus Thalassarchaeaceae archaeon]